MYCTVSLIRKACTNMFCSFTKLLAVLASVPRTQCFSLELFHSGVMNSNFLFPLEGRNLSEVTDQEFVQAAREGLVISDRRTKVVKITSTVVLKIGAQVYEQEARNMVYVATHSRGYVHVPHLFRFFTSEGLGYLAMDFIDGDSLDTIDWSKRTLDSQENILSQATDALMCMRNMLSDEPGPVGGGIPAGGLFSIYGANTTFRTAADMEPWFNKKLDILRAGNVTGKFKGLVMSHMDFRLRNLIVDKAGKLWILDWAWAGFFPSAFELASFRNVRTDDPDAEFAQRLLQRLGPALEEEALITLLLAVYQVNNGPFMGSHVVGAEDS
jgi:hypothetical protein